MAMALDSERRDGLAARALRASETARGPCCPQKRLLSGESTVPSTTMMLPVPLIRIAPKRSSDARKQHMGSTAFKGAQQVAHAGGHI